MKKKLSKFLKLGVKRIGLEEKESLHLHGYTHLLNGPKATQSLSVHMINISSPLIFFFLFLCSHLYFFCNQVYDIPSPKSPLLLLAYPATAMKHISSSHLPFSLWNSSLFFSMSLIIIILFVSSDHF